ncbi:MAG: DUF4368 domain-containing protein, partial [Clostridia bacterium]|nr:DUF4368 domain-containing protein [Clostridia bacterium]
DFELDFDKAKERYIRRKSNHNSQSRYSDEKNLKTLKNRLAELDKLIENAFEEKVLNNLPESVCANLIEKYLKEKISVDEEISEIQKKLKEKNDIFDGVEEYIKKLKSYLSCESLTREMCLQLINFITVGEKDENGRDIHIYYNLLNG